jgi:putative NADPH-quinone reductase
MRISLLLAHPRPGSFNHALADAVRQQLVCDGHVVDFHDLYAEGFDPLLPADELNSLGPIPNSLRQYCEEAAAADGFVIVHPNWWGQPPAVLTGWVDRVLRAGVAYRFIEGDNGEGVPVGLLRAKVAVILNTSNTPAAREQEAFGDPLENIWKRCIFDLCGVRRVERRMFAVVVTSTPEQRGQWLAETRSLIRATFPA